MYAGRTSARDVELALEEVPGSGDVSVQQLALAAGGPGGAGFGFDFRITFSTRRGDVPLIAAIAGSASDTTEGLALGGGYALALADNSTFYS